MVRVMCFNMLNQSLAFLDCVRNRFLQVNVLAGLASQNADDRMPRRAVHARRTSHTAPERVTTAASESKTIEH